MYSTIRNMEYFGIFFSQAIMFGILIAIFSKRYIATCVFILILQLFFLVVYKLFMLLPIDRIKKWLAGNIMTEEQEAELDELHKELIELYRRKSQKAPLLQRQGVRRFETEEDEELNSELQKVIQNIKIIKGIDRVNNADDDNLLDHQDTHKLEQTDNMMKMMQLNMSKLLKQKESKIILKMGAQLSELEQQKLEEKHRSQDEFLKLVYAHPVEVFKYQWPRFFEKVSLDTKLKTYHQ